MTIKELPAAAIEWCDENDQPAEAFAIYLDNLLLDPEKWEDYTTRFLDSYRGLWNSVEEYADDLAHETWFCPCENQRLWNGACYFDAEKFGRDLVAGDIWTETAEDYLGLHIFYNC